jgi:hypothetical protein
VNIDQLLESLAENDPNTFRVMTQFERKRRTARNRWYAASGGLAVAAAAIAAVALLPAINFGSATMSSSSAAGSAAEPASLPQATPRPASGEGASSPAYYSGSLPSCAAVPLRQAITTAVRQGGSVIVGYGTATGTSVAGNQATGGAPAYYAVTLRSVRTLAGPKVASGSTAWIPGSISAGTAGTASSPEGGTLWAPDGQLFAIVTPTVAGSPRGPVLRSAPVINGQVIFSSYGCWDVAGLQARPYGGTAQIFGPVRVSSGAERPLALSSEPLYAVPLASVEKIASEK